MVSVGLECLLLLEHWCHSMMTSWHGKAFHMTGPSGRESNDAPHKEPVMRKFDYSFVFARSNSWKESRGVYDSRRNNADVTSCDVT